MWQLSQFEMEHTGEGDAILEEEELDSDGEGE